MLLESLVQSAKERVRLATLHASCLLLSAAFAASLFASEDDFPRADPGVFGAWRTDCSTQSESRERVCIANQLVITKEGRQAVLGVMVGYQKAHPAPHIIFRVTANADEDKGAAVKVDELNSIRVPIESCDESVCEVRSFIPDQLLAQMRTGKVLLFGFFVEGEEVVYPVSLDGFDAAYTKLFEQKAI